MIAKTGFRIAGALALLSSAQLSAAQAEQCLTEPEIRGLITYALPAVANAVVERCSSRLPESSFLNTRGPQLISDLRRGQSAAWPVAREVLIKMAGRNTDSAEAAETMRDLPESMVSPMLEGMLADRIGDDIKAQDCRDIDRVLGPLAPLPAANMVDLITQIAMIGARDSKKLPACPTS